MSHFLPCFGSEFPSVLRIESNRIIFGPQMPASLIPAWAGGSGGGGRPGGAMSWTRRDVRLGPAPCPHHHTDSLSAAGGPGPRTTWRISGQGCGMDGTPLTSREGRNNGVTAASVGLWPTACGTLEGLKARARRKRRRKEGPGQPEGVGPAASSGV